MSMLNGRSLEPLPDVDLVMVLCFLIGLLLSLSHFLQILANYRCCSTSILCNLVLTIVFFGILNYSTHNADGNYSSSKKELKIGCKYVKNMKTITALRSYNSSLHFQTFD
ncbi:hypothetical protein O6H91_Y531100 [Diphasiastrum complanatum]|nr:hypothetical protein O6H91_Y531100 [Diphasiastrum complanatum]